MSTNDEQVNVQGSLEKNLRESNWAKGANASNEYNQSVFLERV